VTVSAITVAVIVLAALVAITLLFLVAVLRSHAELLRRLGTLERRLGDDAGEADRTGSEPLGRPADTPTDPHAPDIAGETLAGDAVKVALGAGGPRTLLAFLSTGCSVCGGLWEELRAGGPAAPRVRIVVVTRGPERESVTRLRRLAPAPGQCDLVMSSAAWDDYGVTATPHFVLVDSAQRRILGRGGATGWEQILSLLADADSDLAIHRARTTSDRAARAEQALAAAGIVPGHPSLYPSRPAEEAP
jgi:hypothetical protein